MSMADINWGLVFLYFTAGVFWAVLFNANYKAIKYQFRKRFGKKNLVQTTPQLDDLIAGLKKAAQEAANNGVAAMKAKGVEVQTFHWRHKGKMQEVKIIIDPALDTVIQGSREEFEKLLQSGEAGSLEDLMNHLAKPDSKQKLSEITEFRLSRKSVEQMRLVGKEPEEVVAQMLRAAGRMD